MKDYRSYLKAVGRRPIPKNLRTVKRPGDVEFGYCRKAGAYVAVVHGPREEASNVVPFPSPLVEVESVGGGR